MPTATELQIALRHPVAFVADEDPRLSRFVFSTPQGPVEATANEAIGPLSQGIRAMNADPSVRAWATPAILALRLMAAGALTSPSDHERQQLLDAGRPIGATAADGQAQIQGFLDALAVDAPSVATTPQRRRTPEQPRPTIEPPSTFAYLLVVRFLDEPDHERIATAELKVQPADKRWPASTAADVLSRADHHFGAIAQAAIPTMVERWATNWPTASRLLPDGHTTVTADELGALADAHAQVSLLANRITVDWPDDLRRDAQAVPVLRQVETPGRPMSRPRGFGRSQLFSLDWSISVAGVRLSQAELDELSLSSTGLIRLRDQWVWLDRRELDRALSPTSETISPIEALRATVSGTVTIDGREMDVDVVGWLEGVRDRLARQSEDIVPAAQPTALAGQLRDYQLQGLQWMSQLTDLGLGGILADDMGLGKTLMLIALHLQHASDAATLVVCPASVLATWEREIARFAPGVRVRRFHGPGRHLDGADDGFVITTYATMRSSAVDLARHPWGLVVADEAQHVKNPRSGAAQALRTIGSDARMALTGTPVENNLGELWAILDWTTPGLLGTREQFRRSWSRPIERDHDDRRASDLSRLIGPFVLRRRKSDPGIAPELPPKIETDYHVPLTREQIGLYEAVVREAMAEIEESTGMRRRGLVVRVITRLKQICNHPAQFLHEPNAHLAGRSGKLAALDELIDEILSEEGAVLIFTQYARMGDLLARHFKERGTKFQFLHGGTPVATREAMVERFQSGQVPVFVLSLKAAGTGLNLTRADHVVHFDRWWNPAVEDQATDRAHRIGQTKAVQVHRLVAEGTIEESIADLINAKRALADAVVNAGESALTELSDSELAALVSLRR